MFENIAAIDIGSSCVKILIVKTGFHDFQVRSFYYEEIDPDQENPREGIRHALANLLRECDLGGYKILTNFPMERQIIHSISFPFSDPEKIAAAIPFEAEENIPYRIDDLIMDFQPLKSENREEGRIMLAAAPRAAVLDYLNQLNEFNLKPLKMGMESNALFECYKYFNTIAEEAIVQIDIGNSKTVVNLIRNNSLCFTRAIPVGTGALHQKTAEILKKSIRDSVDLLKNLNLDLTSYENNLQKGFYKTLGLTSQKLKKIHISSLEIIHELIEQTALTLKSFFADREPFTFSRILISGGGAGIIGLGSLFSQETDLPVVAQPFLDEYKDAAIQTRFPIAFGTVLTYLNKKKQYVNFLKGEFLPDIARASYKIYYPAIGFLSLAVLVLIFKLILSLMVTSNINKKNNEILSARFQNYFHRRPKDADPVDEARKILAKEKKEFEGMKIMLSEEEPVLEVLKGFISRFPKSQGEFELKNLVINKRVVRIDGTANSARVIEEFKENLIKSGKYESVSSSMLNYTKNEATFTVNIKLKVQGDRKEPVKE